MALLLSIFSLLLVSALSAAMLTSGLTEQLISQNQERAVQARAAAEAGLNLGLAVVGTYVRNWQPNGFVNASAAMSALMRGPDNQSGTLATDADNGSLENFGIARPPARVALSAATQVAYDVRVMDEDDAARGLTLTPADRARIGENGNGVADGNTRIVVRANGYGAGGTTVSLEAIIGPVILPAIVTNGNLSISGNPSINGSNGSVHANGDLTISGNPTVSQNATASGIYATSGSPNIGGSSGGSRPTLPIPPIRAIDSRPLADWVLTSTGHMTTLAGAVVCNASVNNNACKAAYGWKFEGAGRWAIDGNNATNGTFYVEGDAKISGNPGSPASPLAISIIAEGNIEISGNPDLRPDQPELMFVTDKDLKISGQLGQPLAFEGQMLVREQLMISGNPTLAGQILVENAASTSNLVTDNSISGNASITYNGLVGSNTFTVTGWRIVR